MAHEIDTEARDQDDITRDPFHPFYLVCIQLGYENLIEDVKPPAKIYSPVFWKWRKYLINRTRCSKRIWLFWEWISPSGKKEFALKLRDYRLSTK